MLSEAKALGPIQMDRVNQCLKFDYFEEIMKIIRKHTVIMTQFAVEESIKQRREIFKTDPNFIKPYFSLIDATNKWVKDTEKANMVEIFTGL